MRKKISIALLLIMLLVTLVACGGSTHAELTEATPAPTEADVGFVVHAHVPKQWNSVGLWAWNAVENKNVFDYWPGVAMETGGDGWYTFTVPSWVDSVIVNGNNGEVQTADIPVEARNLWIVVKRDLSYELSYEEPDITERYVAVHAYVPDEWSAPCCWAWSGSENVSENWPGEKMSEDGNWYTVLIPDWADNLVINGNEGTVQTEDLSVTAGNDVWIVVSDPETSTVFYNQPTVDEVSALIHRWVEATCSNVRYCADCMITEGDFGDHVWDESGCIKCCSLCGVTEVTTAAHNLGEGSDSISGVCTVCDKYVDYYIEDEKVYAWTEFETATDGRHANPVTYLKAQWGDSFKAIAWFDDGQLMGYESESFEKSTYCDAYYAGGKVYYFVHYAEADESTVRALANAAYAYVPWHSVVYGEANCVYGNLVGPGGWLEDDRGHVYAALDIYGNQYAIVHKSSGSWDVPDDPTQTWAVPCNWKK